MPTDASFEVELTEDANATNLRYRDAVRLADGDVVLVMTDVGAGRPPEPDVLGRWKQAIRSEAAKGSGPNTLLQLLNREAFEGGLQMSGICARLAVRDRLLNVACAGTAAPVVIRASGAVAPSPTAPTVLLGQVRAAQFTERGVGLGSGDSVLVPSLAWAKALVEVLPNVLAELAPQPGPRLAGALRALSPQPAGGSLLCLLLS